MSPPVHAGSYKELMLFLAIAGVVVPLFSRLRISPVLGFIGAGALLGPYGLGRFESQAPWLASFTIGNPGEYAHLAEFGVVFLLFTIGIELSLERLKTLRRLVFGLGAAQVVVSALLLAGLGSLLGLPAKATAIGGIALALSSTAIVIPILASQKRLNSATGRATFSILLFQDLAVAPVLFTLAAVDTAGDGGFLKSFLLALAQAASALVVIVVVGRLALRPLFQLVAQTRSPELFMAACLLIVIGTALVAERSGLSMALGAFVAGLLLAETEYRRAIEAMVDPFKGLLLGVFFVSVGMGLDVTAIARAPLAVAAIAIAIILVKGIVIYGSGRLFRLQPRTAMEAGLLLAPGGEFAFVIVGAAIGTGFLSGDVGQPILVVTTVSMIAIPIIDRIGRPLGQRLMKPPTAEPQVLPAPDDGGNRVIVAGFGRVGQLVGEMLALHRVPYLAIDSSSPLVKVQREAGKPVYFGDSTSPSFLNACGLETARALVITLDQPSAIQSVVETVRRWRPDLTIVARARDARHASDLYRLGVSDAVPETIEASLQLSEAVLVDIGIAMGPVIASIHERRDVFRRLLQAASGEKAAAAQAAGAAASEPHEFRARRSSGKR